MNKKQVRVKVSEEIYSKLLLKAQEENITMTEVVSSCVGDYFARKTDNTNLWLSKITRIDTEIQNLNVRIRGLHTMFLYFMQTFFYVHPELVKDFGKEEHFRKLLGEVQKWLCKVVDNAKNKNPDFYNEIKNICAKLDEEI